jgi:hypothetical protein
MAFEAVMVSKPGRMTTSEFFTASVGFIRSSWHLAHASSALKSPITLNKCSPAPQAVDKAHKLLVTLTISGVPDGLKNRFSEEGDQ